MGNTTEFRAHFLLLPDDASLKVMLAGCYGWGNDMAAADHPAWNDRGADTDKANAPSPRSMRDLEILRVARPPHQSERPRCAQQPRRRLLQQGPVRGSDSSISSTRSSWIRACRSPSATCRSRISTPAIYETLVARAAPAAGRRIPTTSSARDRLARAYSYGGDATDGHRANGSRSSQARPDDSAVHQRLARAEQQRGNLDAALQTHAQRASHWIRTTHVRSCCIGELLYQRGRAGEAREPLEAAVAHRSASGRRAPPARVRVWRPGRDEQGRAGGAARGRAESEPDARRRPTSRSTATAPRAIEELVGDRRRCARMSQRAARSRTTTSASRSGRRRCTTKPCANSASRPSAAKTRSWCSRRRRKCCCCAATSAEAPDLYRSLVEQEPAQPEAVERAGRRRAPARVSSEQRSAPTANALELDPTTRSRGTTSAWCATTAATRRGGKRIPLGASQQGRALVRCLAQPRACCSGARARNEEARERTRAPLQLDAGIARWRGPVSASC